VSFDEGHAIPVAVGRVAEAVVDMADDRVVSSSVVEAPVADNRGLTTSVALLAKGSWATAKEAEDGWLIDELFLELVGQGLTFSHSPCPWQSARKVG